ncbi:hypothetical protein A1Q2_00131 [Trichosporon asahii var. asahii CBS 8904]|uniref:Caffeine-induced death protein 2 n=1 Tax=Trichosporon asahii var. asahii (strain CBS 8904) TaxID=1220162 RepID=K1WY30_TRIAC|nr:hypothetical protein A1Q2_00131 [Trichosporon asahii var. asahii CBS 8904]
MSGASTPSSTLPFGTASAYADSFPAPAPKELTLGAETCFNLSVFKGVVRQYRKLDDQVVTRLNRAQAQLRDEVRQGKGDSPDGMCAKMWAEMMTGWLNRQKLLTYCQNTVAQNLKIAQAAQAEQAQVAAVPASHDTAPTWGHAGKDGAYPRGVSENQVLADQLANEATVEAIVRKRTLEVFKTRCPFFNPNANDQGWWEIADAGRAGAPGTPTTVPKN